MKLSEEHEYLLPECFWVSLHSITISYNPTLILRRAKTIYAYGWEAFVCCSLMFPWEKYSEKFLKDNCAPRELNYIFEKFLGRLLSISNIAFGTWSELRVTAYLTDTRAKTQGHEHMDMLLGVPWQAKVCVCSLDTCQGQTPSWHGTGRGKSRAFCTQSSEIRLQLCSCPVLMPRTIALSLRVLLRTVGWWCFPHSSFTLWNFSADY